MTKPTQRYACDRCHGQKLRCIHTERGPCVRCAKAKAACSWSQSLRSRKQYFGDSSSAIGPRQQQNQLFTESLGMSMDQHAPLSVTSPLANYPLGVIANQLPSSNVATALDLNLFPTEFAASPGINQPGASARYLLPASQGSDHDNHAHQGDPAGSGAMAASPDWLRSADTNHNTQGALQVCWQQQFNQEWALLSSQAPVTTARLSPNAANDGVGKKPQPPCLLATMRQLSELNVELYAHATAVPKPPVSLSEPLSWKDKDFAIDRTFQLSQRLIEAINKQYPRFLEAASMDVSKDASSTAPYSGSPVDQGFCLLILSCYTRLIETYDRVFANMQACLDRSSVTAREDYVNLPSVQVGSFSLPESSATQIVLILQLSRHLLTRISEIIKAIGVDEQNDNQGAATAECATDPGKLLLKSALTTVKPQEDGLMKRITKLRSTLIELNIL